MAELLGEHLLKEDQLKEIRTAVISWLKPKKTFNDDKKKRKTKNQTFKKMLVILFQYTQICRHTD